MSNIAVSFEYTKLKKELSDLVFEYESLKNQICPSLEREYILNFGLLEYNIYKKDFEIDKIKAKIKLIQKEINHQNQVDIKVIDEKLELKFKDYNKKLKESMDEVSNVLKNKNEFSELSEEDSLKLRKIYKILVKRLHPDLNKDQDEFEKTLFMEVTDAFKMGDLKKLETLYAITPDSKFDVDFSTEADLNRLIIDFKLKISEIRSKYPYTVMDLLANDTEIENYINDLKSLNKDKDEELAYYNNKLNQKLEEVKDFNKNINSD